MRLCSGDDKFSFGDLVYGAVQLPSVSDRKPD